MLLVNLEKLINQTINTNAQNVKDSIAKNVVLLSPQYIDQYQIKVGVICCGRRQTNFMTSILKANKTSVRLNVVNVIWNENQYNILIKKRIYQSLL